jgi:hypothetical protein
MHRYKIPEFFSSLLGFHLPYKRFRIHAVCSRARHRSPDGCLSRWAACHRPEALMIGRHRRTLAWRPSREATHGQVHIAVRAATEALAVFSFALRAKHGGEESTTRLQQRACAEVGVEVLRLSSSDSLRMTDLGNEPCRPQKLLGRFGFGDFADDFAGASLMG